MKIGDDIKFRVGNNIVEGTVIGIEYSNSKSVVEKSYTVMVDEDATIPSWYGSIAIVMPKDIVEVNGAGTMSSHDDNYRRAMGVI